MQRCRDGSVPPVVIHYASGQLFQQRCDTNTNEPEREGKENHRAPIERERESKQRKKKPRQEQMWLESDVQLDHLKELKGPKHQ